MRCVQEPSIAATRLPPPEMPPGTLAENREQDYESASGLSPCRQIEESMAVAMDGTTSRPSSPKVPKSISYPHRQGLETPEVFRLFALGLTVLLRLRRQGRVP